MEAKLVAALPVHPGWQFEPKWDGFRAIAVRDGDAATLWSKSGKPLGRYFPELVAMLLACRSTRFIVDGEIVVPLADHLSFGALQARLHPAASRIARLSHETPAQLILFDLLALDSTDIAAEPLSKRRASLEAFHAKEGNPQLLISPCSRDIDRAHAWLASAGGALDGVVAKKLDHPYRHGERAMAKVKQLRTADCVVGGYRRTADGTGIASLLLGLYNAKGTLDHVGFTSGIAAGERPVLLARFDALAGGAGFSGKAPGGPSRWATGRSAEWTPVRPEAVVEVVYDQVTDGRFRHGTRLHRWRPDKRPDQCTGEQLVREISPAELEALMANG
ncbi:ATP-dependent DNA ligase [Sphingomonas koreensis]|nr:ATP-dependent DNA ligase [Sphingomonas koreensis]